MIPRAGWTSTRRTSPASGDCLRVSRSPCRRSATTTGRSNWALSWFARRYRAWVSMLGIGPVPAVRQALERARWNLSDVERVVINEAFAAVPLAVLRELGLPEDIVNVDGGAIAHGHPIGP